MKILKKSTMIIIIYIIFVLGCLIAIFCRANQDRRQLSAAVRKLNAESYVAIKSPTHSNLQTEDKNKIKLIVEWFNNTNCSKLHKRAMTIKSPIMMLHFMKSDDSYDTITVWEDAQKPNIYIYNHVIRYTIEDTTDFFQSLEVR